MKSLRARSTWASRACMRSNERATWPSSSGDWSPMGWSNVPAAMRLAASFRRSSRTEMARAAPHPTTTATATATSVAIRIWRWTSDGGRVDVAQAAT